jgi:hypothetical protein
MLYDRRAGFGFRCLQLGGDFKSVIEFDTPDNLWQLVTVEAPLPEDFWLGLKIYCYSMHASRE